MKFSTLFSLAALCCTSAQAHDKIDDKPVFVVIHVDLMRDHAEQGVTLLRHYAEAARKENGSGMSELLEEIGRPNHLTLVEEWRNREAYEQHLSLPQTVQFRTSLQPMLGSPFDERLHSEA